MALNIRTLHLLTFIATAAIASVSCAPLMAEFVPERVTPPTPADRGDVPVSISIDSGLKSVEGEPLEKPIQVERRFIVLRETDRPKWVDQAAQLKGDGEHVISLSSDPWKSEFECEESLDAKLKTVVDDYIDDQFGRNDVASRLKLDNEFIKQNVVQAEYAEDLQFSDDSLGLMKQKHLQLVFTPEFRDQIAKRWKEEVVTARLMQFAFGTLALFGVISTAFGYLKADTASRGKHAMRLKLAAIGLLITLLASSVTVARWIPWL